MVFIIVYVEILNGIETKDKNMAIKDKYKKIITGRYPTYSNDDAELLVDTLYQLAFIAVKKYLVERGIQQ